MDLIKSLALASAVLGAVGTTLLFWGSFAFEAPPAYMDEEMIGAMTRRNKARRSKQRFGLSLLLVSFVIQAIVVVADQ